MSSTVANQRPELAAGETRNGKASFANSLDSGELLTGTPLVVEVDSTDLTITNKAVSTTALVVLGETIATAKVVTFTVSGQLTNKSYEILITATTDASNAQTLKRTIHFRVR